MGSEIVAGTVMMRVGTSLPSGMNVTTDAYSRNWDVITGPNAFAMDRSLRAAGWNFFFNAGAVHAVTFGRGVEKNAKQAIDRILTRVRALNFNSVEITEISSKRFLGLPYTSACGHGRQIQVGQTLETS